MKKEECKFCGRWFDEGRLAKHAKGCNEFSRYKEIDRSKSPRVRSTSPRPQQDIQDENKRINDVEENLKKIQQTVSIKSKGNKTSSEKKYKSEKTDQTYNHLYESENNEIKEINFEDKLNELDKQVKGFKNDKNDPKNRFLSTYSTIQKNELDYDKNESTFKKELSKNPKYQLRKNKLDNLHNKIEEYTSTNNNFISNQYNSNFISNNNNVESIMKEYNLDLPQFDENEELNQDNN